MNTRMKFLVGIVACTTFASSNGMGARREDLVYGDIGELAQRSMEKVRLRKEERQARMLEEEQLQKCKNNIEAMFEKWDGPIKQRQYPLLGDKEMALLNEAQARFVRGRDTTLGFLPLLVKAQDPSMLALAGKTLRETIVLGFKEGLNIELVQKLLPIMSDLQSNKRRFLLLRSQPGYGRVQLLNNDGEERAEELESALLGRLLEIKRVIMRMARAWNAPMIQDAIQLPVPGSREVLQLDKPQQQFVGPRDYLLKLWRGEQANIQKVSAQELRRQHELLDGLIDLGCREGLSARVIEGLLRIGALQEGNKKFFANFVRYGSHETTQAAAAAQIGDEQELAEAFGDLRLVRASGYARQKGQRECFYCFGWFDQDELVSPCGRFHRDKICKNCFSDYTFESCPLCRMSLAREET